MCSVEWWVTVTFFLFDEIDNSMCYLLPKGRNNNPIYSSSMHYDVHASGAAVGSDEWINKYSGPRVYGITLSLLLLLDLPSTLHLAEYGGWR